MLRIVSKADTAESFIQIFAHLCDKDSLFIVTRSPKTVGTETRFSINLKTGEPVIKGLAKVIERFDGKNNIYGRMGMRLGFVELDGNSRDFIDRLIAAKQAPRTSPPASAEQVLGTEPTEPANAQPVKAKDPVKSGALRASTATPDKNDPAGAPPKVEERARGSDFILPANPFGELTDTVLEAFIECSLYEEIAGSPDLDSSGNGESETPTGRERFGSEPAHSAFPPVQKVRPATAPPPLPMAATGSMPVPARAPMPGGLNAHALATPPGLPAQPMPGSALVPITPVASAAQPAVNNWKAMAVAVILATLVSLGVGYLIWGGGSGSGSGSGSTSSEGHEEPSTSRGGDKGDKGDKGEKGEKGKDRQDTESAKPDEHADQGATTAELEKSTNAPADPDPGAPTEGTAGKSTAAEPAANTAADECQVSIKTQPSRALVYMGERELGATPLDTTLPCGSVQLRFVRARRDPKLATATLVPGRNNEVEVDLARPSVELVVSSDPGGADVYLNGSNRGKTPLTLRVSGYRSTTLELKKAGYKPYKTRVYPKGPRFRVDTQLSKLRQR